METTPAPGLTDAQFDDLARKVAEHYADDDVRGAERLYEALHLTGILPHMNRKLRWAMRGNLDPDDVRALALLRLIGSLKAGKPITQAMLLTIYRRAAYDIAKKRVLKHEGHDRRRFLRDDEILDQLIDAARHAGDDESSESVDFQHMRSQVDRHLRDLKRNQWAELWLCWCEGVTEGPAVAKRLSITKQKARRLKMELSNYLCGVGRHYFDHLDIAENDR